MATAGSTYVRNIERWSVPATVSIVGVLIAWFYTQQILISHSGVLANAKQMAIHPDSPYQITSYATALLSHWSWRHLVGNLPGLLLVAGYLELETDARTVVLTFVGTGLVTLWCYVAISSLVLPEAYLAGASPGIYGIFGATVVYIALEHRFTRPVSVVVFLVIHIFILRQIILFMTVDVMPALIHLIGAVLGCCAILVIRRGKYHVWTTVKRQFSIRIGTGNQ